MKPDIITVIQITKFTSVIPCSVTVTLVKCNNFHQKFLRFHTLCIIYVVAKCKKKAWSWPAESYYKKAFLSSVTVLQLHMKLKICPVKTKDFWKPCFLSPVFCLDSFSV